MEDLFSAQGAAESVYAHFHATLETSWLSVGDTEDQFISEAENYVNRFGKFVIQRIGRQHHPDFELSDMNLDLFIQKAVAQSYISETVMGYTLGNRNQLTFETEHTNPVDAFSIFTSLLALEAKGFVLGNKRVVDIGSSVADVCIVSRLLGFPSVAIEESGLKHATARWAVQRLKKEGYFGSPGQEMLPALLNAHVYPTRTENKIHSPQVDEILSSADIFYSFPLPHNLEDSLVTFRSYANLNSLLILYSSSITDWHVTPELLNMYDLQPYYLSELGIRSDVEGAFTIKASEHGARWAYVHLQQS